MVHIDGESGEYERSYVNRERGKAVRLLSVMRYTGSLVECDPESGNGHSLACS